MENPANASEPFLLTTSDLKTTESYVLMASDPNLSIDKTTVLEVLATHSRATVSPVKARALTAVRSIMTRLPLTLRPANSMYTTTGNVAATRLVARESTSMVHDDHRLTIDDYQPPADGTQTLDWKNSRMWPPTRPTSSVRLRVYAATRSGFDGIATRTSLSAVAREAIESARLGEWDRSPAAATAAARIISAELEQQINVDYWTDGRDTAEAWALADAVVQTLNRRVTGQPAAQRAVATAFMRRILVDRYQISADIERVKEAIEALGRQGLGVCASNDEATARTAAAMSAPHSKAGTTKTLEHTRHVPTATGYARVPLVSTSPTRSEFQAASWEAVASRRDHAASTIRKAYAYSRLRRLISKAASTWRGEERSRELRDRSDGQEVEEYITSSELGRWLKRAAQHNLSEIDGMMLNDAGEAIMRDAVRKYKRAQGAGSTVASLAEASDELNYLMARLRRHLVRDAGSIATASAGTRGAGEADLPPAAPTAGTGGDDEGRTKEDAVQVERVVNEALESQPSERLQGHKSPTRATERSTPPPPGHDAIAAKTRGDDEVHTADAPAREAPREGMAWAYDTETNNLWEVSQQDYARCVAIGAIRPADRTESGAAWEQRKLDEAYIAERAAARAMRATKRAAARASRMMRSAAYAAAIAAKVTSGAKPTSDDELPELASATESDSSEDSGANMCEREARIRLMSWGTDHPHVHKPEQRGPHTTSASHEHSIEQPPRAAANVAPDRTGNDRPTSACTKGPDEPTGSVSSGSDCTLDTFPTGFEREKLRAARRGLPRPTAERASAYVYATSPSGSVCTGKGVTAKAVGTEPPQCPEQGIRREPSSAASDSDQPSDTTGSQDTGEVRARRANLEWTEFYEHVRVLDSRQSETPLARPHYISNYRSTVPYGADPTVDATTDRVDKAIEALNELLEQLADLQANGAPSPGTPGGDTKTSKKVTKLGRDIRRAHIILNLCMETADMTAAMFRCGITNMRKEHQGGGVNNRTMPYVGVPVVARAMPAATVGAKILVDLTEGPESPASPAQARMNPAEESGSPERSSPALSTPTRTWPFLKYGNVPSIEHIARVELENARDNKFYDEYIDKRNKIEEVKDRKEDPSERWNDSGYEPRTTPPVTRSSAAQPDARIGMLRVMESRKQNGARSG